VSPFAVGLISLFAACMLWGAGHPVLRWLTLSMPFESILFWRWIAAFLVGLMISWRHVSREAPLVIRHWRWFLSLAVNGVALSSMLTFGAASYTQVLNFSLLGATAPLWVLIIGVATKAERFSALSVIGVMLGMFGVILIVSRGDPLTLLEINFNIGDIMATASAVTWACYILTMRRRPPGLHPLTIFTVSAALGIACFLPFCLWRWIVEGRDLFMRPDAPASMLSLIGGVLFTGLGGSLVGLIAWNHGVSRTSAAAAGVFLYLIPMVSSALAMLFLNEPLEMYHLVAVGFILPGMYLATRPTAR
jgi:drug/metabolite transporter (DMT)-like permease